MTNEKPATVPVTGSERLIPANARPLGAVSADSVVAVTLMLRRRADVARGADPADAADNSIQAHLARAATGRPVHLEPAQLAARFGAAPADIKAVERFARAAGLEVLESSAAQRRIVVRGTVGVLSNAFGVHLQNYAADDGEPFRCRSGPVHVPDTLAGIVEGVFGLDDRVQARAHFRLQRPAATGILAHTASVSYTPLQLAAAYAFPKAGQGHGQCIGIIELGGGYKAPELTHYFNGLGITPPHVTSHPVDGAGNHPSGDASSADGEVLLDIEVAGAIAQGARIAVYFAPNTDAGFLDAISTAIHDPVARPSVVSISWGGPEASWTAQAMKAMDAVFQDAALLGVTVCCAAGDDGSSDQRAPAKDDGRLHADFPASSPFALACGGTRLQSSGDPGAAGDTGGTETVWNQGRSGGATGGGVSEIFPKPAWQAAAGVPRSANPGHHAGRGLPDLAANADPATGYQIEVDGQRMVIGGTSAVAPLYAALIALCNEQLGRRLGHLNPVLYRLPASAQVFREIDRGDNDISGAHGPYAAGVGWDACTGLGSVHGMRLLAALKAL